MKSKLTAAEIQEAELAKDLRRNNRNRSFGVMRHVRDVGWAKLSNGAIIEWPVSAELEEYVPRTVVPEGHFILHINGEKAVFEAEEFRKWLRWV